MCERERERERGGGRDSMLTHAKILFRSETKVTFTAMFMTLYKLVRSAALVSGSMKGQSASVKAGSMTAWVCKDRFS